MTLRTAATFLFSVIAFIVLAMATGLISANVRKLADRHGWDNFLIRGWDQLPQKWLDKLPHRERLQRFWWLWFIFGASGGVAVALWLTPIPPKSTFLALDDGQKWRFSESLRRAVMPPGPFEPINCEFTSNSSGKFASGVFTELRQILDLAGWKQARILGMRHGVGQHDYLPGFTILSGADKGPAFICAAALGAALQDTLPTAPVSVRSNQVTETLMGCENNCVEIDIGDFRPH